MIIGHIDSKDSAGRGLGIKVEPNSLTSHKIYKSQQSRGPTHELTRTRSWLQVNIGRLNIALRNRNSYLASGLVSKARV